MEHGSATLVCASVPHNGPNKSTQLLTDQGSMHSNSQRSSVEHSRFHNVSRSIWIQGPRRPAHYMESNRTRPARIHSARDHETPYPILNCGQVAAFLRLGLATFVHPRRNGNGMKYDGDDSAATRCPRGWKGQHLMQTNDYVIGFTTAHTSPSLTCRKHGAESS